MTDTDPEGELRELLAQVERHREALLEYRQSVHHEMVELHESELRELYARIRRHCAQNRLVIPSGVPIESD